MEVCACAYVHTHVCMYVRMHVLWVCVLVCVCRHVQYVCMCEVVTVSIVHLSVCVGRLAR